MKAIEINNNWKLYPTLPKVWNNKQPYNAIEEGFKDVVRPAISNTQRLGMLIYDDVNDVLTYQVIDKTEEEISYEIVEHEFQKYLQRKTDGENAYLQISAEFRMAKISGAISEEKHLYIENLLKPVRDEIMFGQWMEGLRLLELIEIEQIGDELYNRLHLQISNYVSKNY